jgi:hypothetical protein
MQSPLPPRLFHCRARVLFGLALVSIAHSQQTRFLSGIVTSNDEPVSGVVVSIDNSGDDKTTGTGEFKVPLAPNFRVGLPITIRVKDWVVIDPYVGGNGRTPLPDPDAEREMVRVLRKGDRRLLANDRLYRIVEERFSRLQVEPDRPSSFSRDKASGPQPASGTSEPTNTSPLPKKPGKESKSCLV